MCGLFAYNGKNTKLLNDTVRASFNKIKYRGPDDSKWELCSSNIILGFHRLAIMDISHQGDQPFVNTITTNKLVCNGEIFNSTELAQEFLDFNFKSNSDCEVLIPLIEKYGLEKACIMLDAEFALVFFDAKQNTILAARDAMGIRPLFYGHDSDGGIVFASEAKVLTDFCSDVKPFPPGHYYNGKEILSFRSMINQKIRDKDENLETIFKNIRKLLVNAVTKRLHADVEVGFLLSGGLDSSLVCAIAQKALNKPISTFAVGCDVDAIDVQYAQQVADYLKTNHTTLLFSHKEALDIIEKVIYHLETWDITTIRASVGMFLLCKKIANVSNVKVLLSGEVSDELFGYKYTDYAPSPEAFQQESQKRIKELYLYDVLRADRCISGNSIEARVPFGDLEFIDYVMGINPKIKMNNWNIGKYLLRTAFKGDYLPDEILFREKAAFSDAVGHSVVDTIKSYADSMYSDSEYNTLKNIYPEQNRPFTKESLYYREIYTKLFPNQNQLLHDYWMPNQSWENCKVDDPSARILPNYGDSGV